jgi:uncharacterized membrane protein (DUF441 family)
MSNFITSLVRTYVPIFVGAVVSYLATRGIEIDAEAAAGLAAFLGGFASAVYYFGVRLIERRIPSAGVLLGSVKTPDYK